MPVVAPRPGRFGIRAGRLLLTRLALFASSRDVYLLVEKIHPLNLLPSCSMQPRRRAQRMPFEENCAA